MLIVFFDMEGVVRYEYVPQGQTVNQQFFSTSFETSETCCFLQEATETGSRDLGATSLQCTTIHRTFHPGIIGKSWHSCHSPTTLLPWHGSVWHLVIPPIKNNFERKEIWRHWLNKEECDKYAEHHPKRLSKNVSSSGRTTGSSVLAHKESILKIIEYF